MSAVQLRVWEVARGADNSATAAAARAEQRVEAPFLDATWKEDGSHVFAVGCDNAVRMWNLQTNTLTQVGAVGCWNDRCPVLKRLPGMHVGWLIAGSMKAAGIASPAIAAATAWSFRMLCAVGRHCCRHSGLSLSRGRRRLRAVYCLPSLGGTRALASNCACLRLPAPACTSCTVLTPPLPRPALPTAALRSAARGRLPPLPAARSTRQVLPLGEGGAVPGNGGLGPHR